MSNSRYSKHGNGGSTVELSKRFGTRRHQGLIRQVFHWRSLGYIGWVIETCVWLRNYDYDYYIHPVV